MYLTEISLNYMQNRGMTVKKHSKAGKLVATCLSAIFLLMYLGSTASAMSGISQQAITPDKMKEWDNGARVTRTGSGTGKNYLANVKADTNGLKKGYYSVYLYDSASCGINPRGGICFDFKNLSNAKMKISLTLVANSRTSFCMSDASYAILEPAGQNIRENIVPAYGTVAIPAGFDGTVYVPFATLCNSDGKHISSDSIQSWGITAVMSENQQIQYQMSNIGFISENSDFLKNYYFVTLSGNDNVTVPQGGSVIRTYGARVKDISGNPIQQPVTFFLPRNVAGASISKDGNLEVSSQCSAPDIEVCAKLANGEGCGEMTVDLKHASAAAASVGIPKPSEMPKITTAADTKLNGLVDVIRFAAVVIALICGTVFYSWFSESTKNYDKIRSELYHVDEYERVEKP